MYIKIKGDPEKKQVSNLIQYAHEYGLVSEAFLIQIIGQTS